MAENALQNFAIGIMVYVSVLSSGMGTFVKKIEGPLGNKMHLICPKMGGLKHGPAYLLALKQGGYLGQSRA